MNRVWLSSKGRFIYRLVYTESIQFVLGSTYTSVASISCRTLSAQNEVRLLTSGLKPRLPHTFLRFVVVTTVPNLLQLNLLFSIAIFTLSESLWKLNITILLQIEELIYIFKWASCIFSKENKN